MSSSQLYSELDLLNLVIAMSFEQKTAGIDNIFFQEGYRIVSIDRSVNTDLGTIKYDIYLSNPIKDISLGFELKGFKASNLEIEQLNKYQQVPIKQYLALGGAFYQDDNKHRLQTIIGINKSRELPVKNYIQINGFTFPLVTIDKETNIIQIVFGSVIDTEVHEKLGNIMFNTFGIPAYVYYDKESKSYEIAPRIINKIFQFAKKDYLEFSVDEIVEETYCGIPDLHNIIGFDVKKSVIEKIKKLLKDMSKKEFSSYIDWDSKTKKWKIQKLSSKSHTNTDTTFLQLGKQYVIRLKQNIDFIEHEFEQLTLFSDEVLEEIM